MDGWNQQFNAYRTKTGGLPWWVTRLPMAALLLLLIPAVLAAIAAVLAAAILFVVLLVLWRAVSAFFPPVATPEPDDGRVNVRVVGREE